MGDIRELNFQYDLAISAGSGDKKVSSLTERKRASLHESRNNMHLTIQLVNLDKRTIHGQYNKRFLSIPKYPAKKANLE